MFEAFQAAGLLGNPPKIQFGRNDLEYPGQVVSAEAPFTLDHAKVKT